MQVRLATELDAPGVWEAHTRAIRELCSRDYTTEQIEAWAGPRRPGDYLGPIRTKRMFVAEVDGRIAGFGEYQDERREICAVYVHPNFARKGVGRALFLRVTTECRGRGLVQVWLDASLTSVPFYLAQGCQKIAERAHAIGAGFSLPCVRMHFDL